MVPRDMFQFDLREIGEAAFPEDINKGKLDSVSICKCDLFAMLDKCNNLVSKYI
jgi:hypothetical protein